MGPVRSIFVTLIILSSLSYGHCLKCAAKAKGGQGCYCSDSDGEDGPAVGRDGGKTLPFMYFQRSPQEDESVVTCQGDQISETQVSTFTATIMAANGCPEESDLINEVNDSLALPISGGKPLCQLSKIVLNSTSIRSINGSQFHRFHFQDLIITNNYNLDLIESTAFKGSREALRKLDLRYSSLTPQAAIDFVRTFSNLEELILQVDDLRRLKRTYFQGQVLAKLQILDLRGNMISSIDDFAFFDLVNLRQLKLSENNLHTLSPSVFTFDLPPTRLSSTKLHLLLAHNRLSSAQVAPLALGHFKRPIWLDLSHNLLSSLPKEPFLTFLYADHRNVINFDGNPLICDQQLSWISQHVRYLNYSRGGLDDDVNTVYRVELVNGMTYLHKRTYPDYTYYKIRDALCEDGANVFSKNLMSYRSLEQNKCALICDSS
ncbi:Immunoglobulin superfamily member 10 [Halotydeus destructor]|nr:Immunoglobulin superfamily member 10 [Halotydeus destructor]